MKKEFNLGFLALQESMVEIVERKDVNGLWGRTGLEFEFVPAVGLSGGLISIWDPTVFQAKGVVKDRNFLLIIGKVHGCDEEVLLMNVYAPQEQRDKIVLWDKILQLIGSKIGCWVLMGDFNEVRDQSERRNSAFNAANARYFNDFIAQAELHEYNMGGWQIYLYVVFDPLFK